MCPPCWPQEPWFQEDRGNIRDIFILSSGCTTWEDTLLPPDAKISTGYVKSHRPGTEKAEDGIQERNSNEAVL